jgi:peptidoglycan/LPS O-acetylase OafA/YrhL
MLTLAQKLGLAKGRPSGFDYMRLCLSVSVVLMHTVVVSYGDAGAAVFWSTPLKPFYRLVLPMFFALSGFLVAGSLERCKTIGTFLGLRAIRIYPALAVEVLLSAFILGPLMTSVTLPEYFSDVQLREYLLNVLGDIHFRLPGVFADNPVQFTVNGQLWTVPFELLCYIGLTGMAMLGIVKQRQIGWFALFITTAVFLAARLYKYGGHCPELDVTNPGSLKAFPGMFLIVAFLAGLVLFLYRDKVRWSGKLAAASAILTVALLGPVPFGESFSPLPVAYLTVYLGLTNFRRVSFLRHADLSYGIFLYGYVVQQTVAHMLPWSRHWYLNFAIALPLTVLVAAVSWHFIERPALGLRSYLYRIEDWYVARRFRKP